MHHLAVHQSTIQIPATKFQQATVHQSTIQQSIHLTSHGIMAGGSSKKELNEGDAEVNEIFDKYMASEQTVPTSFVRIGYVLGRGYAAKNS